MSSDRYPVTEWFVVFQDAKTIWWHKFLRPGFRHCLMFGFDPSNDHWILIEPTFTGAYVGCVPRETLDCFISGARESGCPIIVFRPRQDRKTIIPRPLLTCVTAIAHILNASWWVFTPSQLYRYLLANGGKPAFKSA